MLMDLFTDWLVGTLIGSFLAITILACVAIGADYAFGHTETWPVVVIGKSYSPSSSSTGVATGVTSNGSIATGVVTTSESEKYVLIVKTDDGDVFSYKAQSTDWANVREKDRIKIAVRIGRWSNARY